MDQQQQTTTTQVEEPQQQQQQQQVEEMISETPTQMDENFMAQLKNIQSRKERQRVMQKHLATMKVGLEQMDDSFQEEWFNNLKCIREDNKTIEQLLVNMERDGTCSTDAIALVRGMLHDKDAASAVVRDRLIEFAGANSKMHIQKDQRILTLQTEKRRIEDENADLRKQLEESAKRPKVSAYTTPSSYVPPQQQQQQQSSSSQQQQGGESLLRTGKVVGGSSVNEYLKKWLPQSGSPYYDHMRYTTQSTGQKAIADQLAQMQQNYMSSARPY